MRAGELRGLAFDLLPTFERPQFTVVVATALVAAVLLSCQLVALTEPKARCRGG